MTPHNENFDPQQYGFRDQNTVSDSTINDSVTQSWTSQSLAPLDTNRISPGYRNIYSSRNSFAPQTGLPESFLASPNIGPTSSCTYPNTFSPQADSGSSFRPQDPLMRPNEGSISSPTPNYNYLTPAPTSGYPRQTAQYGMVPAGSHTCEWKGCHSPTNYRRPEDLLRHVRTQHICPSRFKCSECSRSFNRRDNLTAHIQRIHGE